MKNQNQNPERRFLQKLLPKILAYPSSHYIVPPGDDAAVLSTPQGLVLSIDGMTEGIHFNSSWANKINKKFGFSFGRALGWKALGSALSDLAAMGDVQNRWAMVFLGTPDLHNQKFLMDLHHGIQQAAKNYHCDVVGGDTVRSHLLTVAVAVGGMLKSSKPITRNGVQKGDWLCLVGSIGDAAVGLNILQKKLNLSPQAGRYFVKQFFNHKPLFEEGKVLNHLPGVHAMLDVSDSLHESIELILNNTGLGIEIDLEQVPVSSMFKKHILRRSSYLLENGEDYALLVAISSKTIDQVKQRLKMTILGQMTKKVVGPRYYFHHRPLPEPRAFAHFTK